jgi:hypothetical protein
MISLYHHLNRRDWIKAHHIDHHIGRLVEQQYRSADTQSVDDASLAVYTPKRWLVGQSPSRSNISGRRWSETRFFNDACNADHADSPFFAVLGPHRSGTSCVAMIMYHLGVHMGNQLVGYEATGGGEAAALAGLCERAMKFPATDPVISDEQLVGLLKNFVVSKKSEAVRDDTVAGGKYPHLCRFASHLYAAIGNSLRIVSVDRPIEASIRSLQTRSGKHRGQWFAADNSACEELQRSLLRHREDFIASHPQVPVHRISFLDLTTQPRREILRLVGFLGTEPSSEELDAAVAHVNPSLRRHG